MVFCLSVIHTPHSLTGERLFSYNKNTKCTAHSPTYHFKTLFIHPPIYWITLHDMTQQLYEVRKKNLISYYRKHKCLPTYDELAEMFGVRSKGSIHKYIQKFVDEGLVGRSDTGRLIPTSRLYELRVLGSIQAGFPTPTEEEQMETVSLDEYLIKNPTASYLVEVSGDSMMDAGILEGDMVIVDRKKSPVSGDIVVAQIGNEWTLKYFMKRGSTVFLRAANKRYSDIYPDEEMTIGGVVTSVIRKYS